MAPPFEGVGTTVNGQITKMPVVVDSLRPPVDLETKLALAAPVGLQTEPETVMYWSGADCADAVPSPQTNAAQAKPALMEVRMEHPLWCMDFPSARRVCRSYAKRG